MNPWRRIVGCVIVLLVAGAAQPQGRAKISLELFTESGFGVEDSHRWYQLFNDLGVANVQIRGRASGDAIGIQETPRREGHAYQVMGRITAKNVLELPGGKFTLHDSVPLKQWLKNLTEQGPDGIVGQRERFGLTAVQLQEVQDDLKRPIDFSTKDLPAAELVAKIGSGLAHPLNMTPAAHEALAKRKFADELKRLSSGTALAIVLRAADLALTPERLESKGVSYRVTPPATGREAWPLGRSSEKADRDLIPDFFKFVNVEIDETPLVDAVERIQDRLPIPLVWDSYAIESQGVKPAEIKVQLPTKRLSYGMILQRILSQGKLVRELRVDDAGTPFVWITTLKPASRGP
jgi:hypothetical protein